MARPRYEVFAKSGRQRIAHVNAQRTDLKPDPKLGELGAAMGKGHILPAPVLPLGRFDTFILPTPMARGIEHFPLKAVIYDASGEAAGEHRFGNLPRDHASLLDVSALLADKGKELPSGYGHVELAYDFEAGREADGWMHGLFRYRELHQRPRRRKLVRQPHVQLGAGLQERAAKLFGARAGADHAAIPSHRPEAL